MITVYYILHRAWKSSLQDTLKYLVITVFKIHCKILSVYLKYYLKCIYCEHHCI